MLRLILISNPIQERQATADVYLGCDTCVVSDDESPHFQILQPIYDHPPTDRPNQPLNMNLEPLSHVGTKVKVKQGPREGMGNAKGNAKARNHEYDFVFVGSVRVPRSLHRIAANKHPASYSLTNPKSESLLASANLFLVGFGVASVVSSTPWLLLF
ncbi:hypothetical protein DL95DRAFT_399806 [Leptodontidium sp. 2 PMI_412]|nr:hypothetical protein DL95DRAFT_399806 [Leptodontidium sp. 2 PMI_412]